MTPFDAKYEIHVHADIPLRSNVSIEEVSSALAPLWKFMEASDFEDGAQSYYSDEPGIFLSQNGHILHMCWTTQGDASFEDVSLEICESLNKLASEGAPVEVSYFDLDDDSSEDDYQQLYFVGPDSQAIIKAQRDLLVKEVMDLMERHFSAAHLGGIIAEIDHLFEVHGHTFEAASQSFKTTWMGIPFAGLCDPTRRRLH